MRKILAFLAVLLFSAAAVAALHFPPLTGRVVDDAHILSPSTVQTLDQMLADYETGTTNQVVVVTLASLQGTSIEDYGYQLGRYWKIGQKGKDNGVLLIVAPHERKVRIEVGYGVEGTLTDAMSHEIIQSIILPEFKSGKMESGIIDGTQATLSVLGGKSVQVSSPQQQQGNLPPWVTILLIIVFIWMAIRHPFLLLYLSSTSRYGSSGGSGGGFSGGGGSFGGGGASGSW